MLNGVSQFLFVFFKLYAALHCFALEPGLTGPSSAVVLRVSSHSLENVASGLHTFMNWRCLPGGLFAFAKLVIFGAAIFALVQVGSAVRVEVVRAGTSPFGLRQLMPPLFAKL